MIINLMVFAIVLIYTKNKGIVIFELKKLDKS
jgi:hypothetical protein